MWSGSSPFAFFSLALSAALTVSAVAAGSARAQARRPGAVLPFDGRGGARARATTVAAVSDALELVPVRRVGEAARRLDADLRAPAGISAVARELGLDVIVGGSVEGRGRQARIIVWALDARGAELALREVGASGRSALVSASSAVVREALGTLETRERTAAEERARERSRRARQARARAARHGETGRDDDSAPPLLVVTGGFGGATRNATVALDEGSRRRYDGGLYPELTLSAELHPLRRASRFLRGIAVRADAAHSIGLRSWSGDEAAGAGDIDSSAWRLRASLGYGLALGDVTLGADFGYGVDSYALGDNQVMPSATYSYVRLAGTGSVSLLDGRLDVSLAIGTRVVLSTGDLVAAFGDRADASGLDGTLRLAARPFGDFQIGAELGHVVYDLSFDGSGEDANGTDATDSAWRAGVTAGWRLP